MAHQLKSLINDIALCSEHFVKTAGIHQGPPELYKDIAQLITKVYANHVLGLINENSIRSTSQDLIELKKEVSKYADKPKAYRSKMSTEIPINLDNWSPYEQLSKKRKLYGWKTLKIIIDFQGHSLRSGLARAGEIEVDMTLVPQTAKGFHQSLDKLKLIARHEVAHIGQYIINNMLGKREGGQPSQKIRTDDEKFKNLDRSQRARLKNVEFYTYLGDAVDEFKSKSKNLSPEQRNDLAKYLVALKTFSPIKTTTDAQIYFQTLRKYAPDKWKKAVKEFFKAIEPELKEYQEKRKGEIPGERTEPIWSIGKMMKSVQDYNKLLSKDPNSKEAKDLLKALEYQESLRQRLVR